MKRFSFAMIMLAVFLCVPGVAEVSVDDPTSEVPFSIEKGHVIVQAQIKNQTPVEVILSTGAEHSTVDTSLIEKYKLQRFYAVCYAAPNGLPVLTGDCGFISAATILYRNRSHGSVSVYLDGSE